MHIYMIGDISESVWYDTAPGCGSPSCQTDRQTQTDTQTA